MTGLAYRTSTAHIVEHERNGATRMNATAYIRGQTNVRIPEPTHSDYRQQRGGEECVGQSLAALVHVPVIDLDLLNWEGDGYGQKRDEDAARRMTLEVSAQSLWIIEGVYGWLAELALPRATALIWLDFPWSLCRAGLLARDPRRGATDQDTAELLKWAETYWNRHTSSSFAGHSRMFNSFPGTKFRLENREEAALLLADLRACTIALKSDE